MRSLRVGILPRVVCFGLAVGTIAGKGGCGSTQGSGVTFSALQSVNAFDAMDVAFHQAMINAGTTEPPLIFSCPSGGMLNITGNQSFEPDAGVTLQFALTGTFQGCGETDPGGATYTMNGSVAWSGSVDGSTGGWDFDEGGNAQQGSSLTWSGTLDFSGAASGSCVIDVQGTVAPLSPVAGSDDGWFYSGTACGESLASLMDNVSP